MLAAILLLPQCTTQSHLKNLDKVIENSKKKLQIKRELKLEEITNVIEFLFKKNRVVTGQTIYLDLQFKCKPLNFKKYHSK